jgi:RNA polymerase sigma-70 factor, ECF subfamily
MYSRVVVATEAPDTFLGKRREKERRGWIPPLAVGSPETETGLLAYLGLVETVALPMFLWNLFSVAVSTVQTESCPASESGLEELMARYTDGDPRAFDEVFRRVSPRLFRYLVRLTRQPDRAEDLVQVTFAKVHRARSAYLRGAPVLPWVFAIGRRAFLDDVRRRKSRHEDLSHDGRLPEPISEVRGVSQDVAEALEAALSNLPPQYAETIELLKLSGLSVRDVAEVLGVSESAVKLRAHRGYALLRKELAPILKLPEMHLP